MIFHSFRLKIGLLSVVLSGLLLTGFGLFALSALNRVGLERVDREVRRPLIEHIDTRTAAIMDRIDRLQTRVDSHADAIRVNLAAAQLARGKAVEMDETLLHREVARTQEMRVMNDMMEAMQRQIGRLEADLRDLRGRA